MTKRNQLLISARQPNKENRFKRATTYILKTNNNNNNNNNNSNNVMYNNNCPQAPSRGGL
jgi:hypothetical protein